MTARISLPILFALVVAGAARADDAKPITAPALTQSAALTDARVSGGRNDEDDRTALAGLAVRKE
jgi:hypothetical protein